MFFDFKKLFPAAAVDDVRLVAKRPMQVRLADGTSQHIDADEEFTTSAATATEFDHSDVRIVGQQPGPVVADPTPPRPNTQSAPARWTQLPKCFTEHFDIMERFRVAGLHLELLRQARIDFFGTDADFGRETSEGKVLSISLDLGQPGIKGNIHSHSREFDLSDPTFRKLARFHHNAQAAAEDHLRELRNTFGLKLQRLHLECGTHRLHSVEALQILVRDIKSIGFDLFSLRVAALELHLTKIMQLYVGSALFAKYGRHDEPSVQGLCFAGMAANGEMRTYIEDPVIQIAGGLLSDLERAAELTPILAEGRAEFAKATKVTKAAA